MLKEKPKCLFCKKLINDKFRPNAKYCDRECMAKMYIQRGALPLKKRRK